MIITNKHHLSQVWVDAVKLNMYDKVGWASCTDLIKPPRARILIDRHYDEIEVDVSDMIWLLFGEAMHYVLEKSADRESIVERRMTFMMCGKEISIKPDRLERIHPEEDKWRLVDLKTSTIWSLIKGGKDEYEQQINVYRYGCRKNGLDVTEARIELLARDWRHYEVEEFNLKNIDYPESQIGVIDVRLWPDSVIENYLTQRIQAHAQAEHLSDTQLPHCTLQERWATADTWAVKKAGGKRALPGGKGFTTESDAEDFARTKAYPCDIEYRKGVSKRCEKYCNARAFCSQFKAMQTMGEGNG